MSDTVHFLLSNESIKIKGSPADLCTLLFDADSIFSGREWNKKLVFLSMLIISTDHCPSSCFIFADIIKKAVLWKAWVSVGELHNSECSWLCVSECTRTSRKCYPFLPCYGFQCLSLCMFFASLFIPLPTVSCNIP